jgi:hypothetical protein
MVFIVLLNNYNIYGPFDFTLNDYDMWHPNMQWMDAMWKFVGPPYFHLVCDLTQGSANQIETHGKIIDNIIY